MNRKFWGIFTAFIFVVATVSAQDEYAKKHFISSKGDTLLYRSIDPQVMVDGEKYPLVLFLHGAGERGNDNELQLIHGSRTFTNPANREKYPAFVVLPQCPNDGFWSIRKVNNLGARMFERDAEITPVLSRVMELVNMYLKNPKVDASRVYVMGISMGGMATFDLVCRFPDLFAAAVPICGGVEPSRLAVAANRVAFSIYHGDADEVVSVNFSRNAYRALREYGVHKDDIRYVEFAGCKHNSWDPAFNYPDFMAWLFNQRKPSLHSLPSK